MAERLKKKNEAYARVYNLADNTSQNVKTENMYVNHTKDVPCLESFPGYRRLNKLDERINGIFPADFGKEIYLVHAGTSLYQCSFATVYRDALNAMRLCDMNDQKSSCYRMGEMICILDGADITIVDKRLNTKKLSSNPDLAYVPTTFINGKEAEQVNMLSDKFIEMENHISVFDMAYESAGLTYQIKSESTSTCVVTGVVDTYSGRVDIPTRKLINGKYYKVVEIGNNAFKSNDKITAVVIPGSVKRVGENAFAHCTSMTYAAMLDGIEIIDAGAFFGCSSMNYVYLGTTCKEIFFNAFYECTRLNKFFFSGDSSLLVDCDGMGEILQYDVYYNYPFTDLGIGVQLHTPTAKIIKVTVDGVSTGYNSFLDRGIVRLPYHQPGDLEGKNIAVWGNIDRSVILNSDRGVSFPIISGELSGFDAICQSSKVVMFDGRVFVYGSEGAGSVIFASSFTLEGRAHPLYFGELDYMEVGNPAFPISAAIGFEKQLVVAKTAENSGSIFIHSPHGTSFAVHGRSYPLSYSLSNTDIRTELYSYDEGLIFMSGEGVCKLSCNSSGADITPISSGITELFDQGNAETTFSTIEGDVAIFTNGMLALGDPRLSYKTHGHDNYRWFPIYNVGGFINEEIVHRYASFAAPGLYIHPDEGAVATGEIYSYRDEEGRMVYYVKVGYRNYSVTPSDEVFGGELVNVSALTRVENTIIFGSGSGDIFAFNTDKIGVPPQSVYHVNNYDRAEYQNLFGKVIHPDFYTHASHRVIYSVTTPKDNLDTPYLTKNSIKNSLTVRLIKRSRDSVCVSAMLDDDRVVELCEIPMGEIDFEDLDFQTITMFCDEFENISIPEKERNWIEKQIKVYTNEHKSPFAINLISYGFLIGGAIKNK